MPMSAPLIPWQDGERIGHQHQHQLAGEDDRQTRGQERRDRRAEACLINEDGMGEISSGRARQRSRASSGSRTETFAAGIYAQSQVI